MVTVARQRRRPSGRATVLVVDDDPANRRLTQIVLSSVYDVVLAADGEEALSQALASPPDIILTDLQMPRMTGQELLLRVRDEPSLCDVPVVVLTGREDVQVRLELLRSGAQDFLIKPFEVEELHIRIANVVRLKLARELLQDELQSREVDIDKLVADVATRRAALEAALQATQLAHEQVRRADQAKRDFLSLVSHEFKTPLTVLGLVFDRWLRRVEASGGVTDREALRVEASLERLKAIVDGVIDYADTHAGDRVSRREPVDLVALIESSREDFNEAAASKGLRLEVEVTDAAKVATIDPRVGGVILRNLIGNAVRNTDAGTIQVRAFIDDELVLTVSDTGRGIGDADCARIFQPFEHGERIDNKSTPGIGLGLTIVRDLATAAGGSVSVRSAKGVGSTFTVTLPIERPASGRDAEAHAVFL